MRDTLNAIWREAPWLAPAPTVDTALRDNSAAPLAAQFIDAVRSLGEPVHELTVHAPFYDTDAGALRHLLDQLTPDRVRVLLRPDTSVDPKTLTATLRAARSAQLFRLAVTGDEATYIHAKWLHATTATHEVMLTGSANLSRPALLTTGSVGNLEAGILQTRARGGFDHLYQPLTLTPLTNLDALDLHLDHHARHQPSRGPCCSGADSTATHCGSPSPTAFDETHSSSPLPTAPPWRPPPPTGMARTCS